LAQKKPSEDGNPYRRELADIRRFKENNPKAELEVLKLVVALRKKIENDIQEERCTCAADFANALLQQSDPIKVRKLVLQDLANWIDIPARRYLFVENENPDAYIEKLRGHLRKREEPIWQVFAHMLGSENAVQIAVDGRVAHWEAQSRKLARDARDRNSSPKGIIDAFMAKEGIPSYFGRDGFTEILEFSDPSATVKVGKDTFLKVIHETERVHDRTYLKIADFIGCQPDQLHPRGIPRAERKRKPKH
jgi:hypothetical protein